VEPQSSGIGGGGFLLYWHAENQTLYSLDAREVAPKLATQDLFLNEQGEPISWIDAVVGGRSVGVPGIVKGLEAAHQRFGSMAWAQLFAEPITRAEQGFVVSPRLAQLVAVEMNPGLKQLSTARDYFYPNGQAIEAGHVLKNEPLARSFRRIAEHGSDGFYTGPLAQAMVTAVQQAERAPGLLQLQDLADYQVEWRKPLCAPYRVYQVCSMEQPSSGGLAVLQMLGMLSHFDMGTTAFSEAPQHYFTQASRLAFADRNHYSADPAFTPVPVNELLQASYLASRAALVAENDMGVAQPGQPAGVKLTAVAGMDYEQPSTSHFSIVDAQGNMVSMTTSIEMGFGSAVMVEGFLLNNQLTDFTFVPEKEGRPVANRVEPGKRPRSSMAPIIVLDENGQPLHALGSPGGSRIINYVAHTLVGLLDWNLNMQEAINLPHITNLNGRTTVEAERAPDAWIEGLRKRGHSVDIRPLNSGIHGISIMPDGRLLGGADPRREGKVVGQ